MLTETPFYYLRHGQTDWNRDGRFQGWTDVPLNAIGLAQARDAAERVRNLGVRTICASPLTRAMMTAEAAQAATGARLKVIDDLKEVGFGVCEGELRGPWYDAWKLGETPEGAESYAGFLARALGAVNAALKEEGPVLIVAHGGVYWSIREHARFDAEGDIPNCQPIHHEPPTSARPWWERRFLGA